MASNKDFLETEAGLLATNPDYIQWYLASPDEMNRLAIAMQNYKTQKSNNIASVAIDQYGKLIKSRFHENDNQIATFTNLATSFVGNEDFKRKIEDATNKMKMPSVSNKSIFTQGDLLKDVNTYQNLINEIKNALTSIIGVLGASDLSALAPKDGSESYDTNKVFNDIKQLYGSDYKEFDRIIKIDEYKTLANSFQGQYRYLLSKIPSFLELAQKSTGTDEDKILIAKILAPIQRLVGISSEIKTEVELQEIIKDLEKSFSQYKNITISRVGDTGDDTFRVGTADLSIILTPKQGEIDMQMPNLGITQKRTTTSLSKNAVLNIHLKSSDYGKILKDVDQNLLTAFYTIYTNARPISPYGVQQKSLPNGLLTDSYKYMKALALITALVGDINAKDLVCIIVINEKAYTIFDFLERIKNKITAGDDNIFSITPAFSTSHGELVKKHIELYESFLKDNIDVGRFKRSSEIRKAIEKISVSCSLKIQTSFLR